MSCTGGTSATSAFGFIRSRCASYACPALPLIPVKFCLQVNNNTTASIQEGCQVSTLTRQNGETYAAPACTVDYSSAITENSWGRKSRVVQFSRLMQSNRFLRIRLCSTLNLSCAATNCGDGSDDIDCSGVMQTNKLLSFTVGSNDVTGILATLALGSSSVTESGSGADNCCSITFSRYCGGVQVVGCHTAVLDQLLWGTEIVVGPMGSLA